jgi:chromosome segregation ATPase
MDPTIVTALVGAGGSLATAAMVGPIVGHVLSRRQRATQQALTEAQAEQMTVQTGLLRQDIYQQITDDLGAELTRVKAELQDARDSLRRTSAEAEGLRLRVVELESRIAQLTSAEQHLSAELRAAQSERDQLRIQIAAKEATISALQREIGDLKDQVARL